MGNKTSKEKVLVSPICDDKINNNTKEVKIGDENNLELLRFCVNNKEQEIITSLASGTDLASPYNGAPLIISAVLGLVNDENEDRFKRNLGSLLNNFNNDIPIMNITDLRLTNFTEDAINLRNTCHPIIHIGSLPKRVVGTRYKKYISGSLGKLRKYDLKNILLYVMTNLQLALEKITENPNSNVFIRYEGSVSNKLEKIIKKNCKFVIDNINKIEKHWSTEVPLQEYYDKYNKEYSMEIPVPTIVK